MGALKKISQKDRNKIITALVGEINKQKPIIMESVECNTIDEVSLEYFKEGLKCGLKIAIDILNEEKHY